MTDDVLDALDDTATTPRASIPSPSTSALGWHAGSRAGDHARYFAGPPRRAAY